MKYAYAELAGMIDHSLLQPTLTDAELEAGCRLDVVGDVLLHLTSIHQPQELRLVIRPTSLALFVVVKNSLSRRQQRLMESEQHQARHAFLHPSDWQILYRLV